jgi:hypothetical protein
VEPRSSAVVALMRMEEGHTPMAPRRRPWMWWRERGGPLLHGWQSYVDVAVQGRRWRGDADAERGLVLNLRQTDLASVGSSIGTDAAGAAIPVGALVRADASGARRAGARRDLVLANGDHLLQAELARHREGSGRRRPPAPGGARATARGPWPVNPGLRRARDEREHTSRRRQRA